MFGLFRKSFTLVAPVDGKIIDLSEVQDPVFAQKMAGDGVAIETTGDIIVSPATGKLSFIFKTNHAFGLNLENGAEILVHIGLDTVVLEGEGFERLASEGDIVKAGEPIIKINRALITDKGYSLITPVLITNFDSVSEIKGNTGDIVKAGESEILTYKMK